MNVAVQWWERHQVLLYVAAIGVGAAVGWLWPVTAPLWAGLTTPVLGLLLFATFLGVPAGDLHEAGRAARHGLVGLGDRGGPGHDGEPHDGGVGCDRAGAGPGHGDGVHGLTVVLPPGGAAQTVIRRFAKISRVAFDRLSV